MNFLYFLEACRTPVLDAVMLLITEFGGAFPFLLLALILFWCVDKKKGYYVMSVGFLGILANQFLKLFCRVPRPWVLDPSFTIVEQARAAATGYSFPSGHTQNAVGSFGALAAVTSRKWIRILCAALILLVPFSRMYVGVHTPKDVLTAGGMALLFVILLYPVFFRRNGRYIPWLLAAMAAGAAGFVLFAELYPFPADIDPENLASGVKNAYTLAGALAGLAVTWVLDRTRIQFPVRAVWWAQIIKVTVGVILVILVKEGLKQPLSALLGGSMAAVSIRYFFVVLTAGVLWPLTFSWFSRLGGRH